MFCFKFQHNRNINLFQISAKSLKWMGTMLKKDYENGQLSCGIYSSPAAARLLLQRLGLRLLDNIEVYILYISL